MSKEEFDILYNYHFPDTNRQYSVNLYLLAASTALRIADVTKVTQKSVIDDDVIKRVKVPIDKLGGQLSRCPLNDISREIIYNRDISIKLSKQNIRDNLRKAFEEILPYMSTSFSKISTYYKKVGGVATPIQKPLYKFLDFHSSRKFFASYYSTIVGRDITMYWGNWEAGGSFDESYIKKNYNEKELVKKF